MCVCVPGVCRCICVSRLRHLYQQDICPRSNGLYIREKLTLHFTLFYLINFSDKLQTSNFFYQFQKYDVGF